MIITLFYYISKNSSLDRNLNFSKLENNLFKEIVGASVAMAPHIHIASRTLKREKQRALKGVFFMPKARTKMLIFFSDNTEMNQKLVLVQNKK